MALSRALDVVNDEAERIFNEARDLAPEDRAEFLEHQCAGNQSLLKELSSLLEHADNAEKFFGSMSADVIPAMAADAVIGRTIGHFRIVSHIDEGGMGSVYRAVDTRLDREVALKILPGTSAEALTEAKHAAALKHANVCVIHDIGETDDGRPFIAMELYEGETLRQRLSRGKLSIDETISTATQIARGLAAAHKRGIVHGDIKPGNVMLGADGTVKLLDFGLARNVDALATKGGLHGTVPYMSPEQTGGGTATERTDLWSFGVVLYEMITGALPFRGDNRDALVHAILYSEPASIGAIVPECPPRLQSIVDRLLAKNAGERYPNVDAVIKDLALSNTSQRRSRTALYGSLAFAIILVMLGIASWRSKAAKKDVAVLEQRRLTKNIAAYELYTRGRDPTLFRSDSGPMRGLALLQQSVALDSTFAGAYAAMTYMYWVMARPGKPDSVHKLQRLAETAARKSIALDPSLPEAWIGLGMAKAVGMEDLIGAEAAMTHAIELGGAPRAHEHLGQILLWRGKINDAVVELRKAVNEDPLSATASAELGHALCFANHADDGLPMLDRLRNLQPRLRRVPGYRADCYIMQNKWQEAIAAVKEEPASLLGAGSIGYSLARSGRRDEAIQMRSALAKTWKVAGAGALDAAMISAGLDDNDGFFQWLDRAAQSAWLNGAIMSPYLRSVQSDPRFAQFRRDHNF